MKSSPSAGHQLPWYSEKYSQVPLIAPVLFETNEPGSPLYNVPSKSLTITLFGARHYSNLQLPT